MSHQHAHDDHADGAATAVLHVGGLHYASEKAVVERVLGRRPGVRAVEANPVAQTATVEYDPEATTLEALRRWVEDCGYHCAGRSVPGHVCDPLAREGEDAPAHDHAAAERAEHAHGHGQGGHAGMSMAAMVRDTRNRFLVALVFAVPIAIWSPLGEALFGDIPPTPFGIGPDVWQFLLSLPVVFYSSAIFFTGAYHALKARTLDMMVLVAVAIGTAWIYSVAVTFFIEGEVFYEAAALLAAFVLLAWGAQTRSRSKSRISRPVSSCTRRPPRNPMPLPALEAAPRAPHRHVGSGAGRAELSDGQPLSFSASSVPWQRCSPLASVPGANPVLPANRPDQWREQSFATPQPFASVRCNDELRNLQHVSTRRRLPSTCLGGALARPGCGRGHAARRVSGSLYPSRESAVSIGRAWSLSRHRAAKVALAARRASRAGRPRCPLAAWRPPLAGSLSRFTGVHRCARIERPSTSEARMGEAGGGEKEAARRGEPALAAAPAVDAVELAEHYDTVLRGFTRGHVVVVLGAGANLMSRPPGEKWALGRFLPSGRELAEHLADVFAYPEVRQRDDLLRVSQYVAVVRGGTGPLYDTLHEVFDADYPTTALHEFLAALPAALRQRRLLRAYPLMLTTNYDDLLERAFDAASEPYDVCMYVADGEDAGKFRHRSPDGESQLIVAPERYLDLSLDQRAVILKVHGFVERGAPLPEDSYVITEDHYIDYLTRTDLAQLVPVNLLARLRSCHFLFLGYSLSDWNLRAILHRLWAQRPQSWDSWAIQLAPDRLERESWERRNVRIFDIPLDSYFDGLSDRLAAALAKEDARP